MCTGIYIGKKCSANGHAIFGRSADSYMKRNCITTIDFGLNKPTLNNGVISCADSKLAYQVPENPIEYLSAPTFPMEPEKSYGILSANKYGVATSGSVTAYTDPKVRQFDPFTDNGFCEQIFNDIIAVSCKTAREGIELVRKIMKEYGTTSAEMYTIADQDEMWHVEMYTGHQWAAIKIPDDKVAAYGNEFMIQTEYVELDDDSFAYSEDLFSLLEDNNLAVYKDGEISLCESYAGRGRLHDYANIRTYFGHKFLAESTAGDYQTKKRYDLFFTPDKPVCLKDVFEYYRYRYEGSEYCPENGRDDIRTIGTECQYVVHVTEIIDDIPSEMSIIAWTCLANAEHSVFIPYSNLNRKFDKAYRYFDSENNIFDIHPEVRDQNNNLVIMDDQIAHSCFKRLCAISEQNRPQYGVGIRSLWDNFECKVTEEYPSIIEEAAEILKQDKTRASEFLDGYVQGVQKLAYAQAKSLFDELIWYISKNVEALQYKLNSDELVLEENKAPVFEPTLCFLKKYYS